MGFEFAPFRPVVSFVVMIDIAEQQTRIALVHDQSNVTADTHRPEVPVPHLVDAVKTHPRAGRVQLQIERGGLDGLLLLAGQARQAIGEGVGDAEFHGNGYRLKVGIARIMKSSKSGTVKSISPCAGL